MARYQRLVWRSRYKAYGFIILYLYRMQQCLKRCDAIVNLFLSEWFLQKSDKLIGDNRYLKILKIKILKIEWDRSYIRLKQILNNMADQRMMLISFEDPWRPINNCLNGVQSLTWECLSCLAACQALARFVCNKRPSNQRLVREYHLFSKFCEWEKICTISHWVMRERKNIYHILTNANY